MNKKTTKGEKEYAQKNYPGAEIDKADGNKAGQRLVDQETKLLNNNPRN